MDAKWATQFGGVLTDSKIERADIITFPYQVVSFVFHISIHATTIYYIAQIWNLGEFWDTRSPHLHLPPHFYIQLVIKP